MEELVFVTGNIGKLEEVRRFLSVPVRHQPLDIDEVQSIDSDLVVTKKAEAAYAQLGVPLMVEDVAVVFPALGRLPGPFIKYFEEELGQEGICRLLDGKDRACVTQVRYGYHDGTCIHIFKGEMPGTVAENPRGTRSWGWASIVVPVGKDKTYAEMTNEEQAEVAMRKPALEKLRAHLET